MRTTRAYASNSSLPDPVDDNSPWRASTDHCDPNQLFSSESEKTEPMTAHSSCETTTASQGVLVIGNASLPTAVGAVILLKRCQATNERYVGYLSPPSRTLWCLETHGDVQVGPNHGDLPLPKRPSFLNRTACPGHLYLGQAKQKSQRDRLRLHQPIRLRPQDCIQRCIIQGAHHFLGRFRRIQPQHQDSNTHSNA